MAKFSTSFSEYLILSYQKSEAQWKVFKIVKKAKKQTKHTNTITLRLKSLHLH